MMRSSWLVLFLATAAAFPFSKQLFEASSDDSSEGPSNLDPDLSKLDGYLQAEKANSINAEGLYVDLQKRFNALKMEWKRAEAERTAMRRALLAAQISANKMSTQNERLTAVLSEVRTNHARMAEAKASVMQALGMDERLNITEILAHD